jgi:hypothetical protein
MNKFNFDNKKFKLLQNSERRKVNPASIFEYKHQENLAIADYFGGTIKLLI